MKTLRRALVSMLLVAGSAPSIPGIPWLTSFAAAQGVREHTRLARTDAPSEEEQRAAEITLTVAPVGRQLLQTWIRTAGEIDSEHKTLSGCVKGEDAALLEPGQRVRSFPADSKSSVYQARVTEVTPRADCVGVTATLSGPTYSDSSRYVMEIIVDRGFRLAVPNAAIIERDGKQVVYEQIHVGHYEPHEIHTGLKGETYTEVLDGVQEGYQIVTIGSFFIDAEYRLKMVPGTGMDAHHHH